MTNRDQRIPCQLCNTPVPFDTEQFLQGFTFSCPNPDCDASYSIPTESRGMVKHAMDEFENLKTKTQKN